MFTTILILISIILALLVIITIFYYNRFSVLNNRIENSLSQIDVQLKKRADLVPNLLEVVKGYMKHEKTIIKEVIEARKALLSAKTIEAKSRAGSDLQHSLKSLFALAENYPNLKANENFLHFQQELSSIEDKVAYARQYYNDSVMDFNTLCSTFPGNFFASLFGRTKKEYLEIAEEEKLVPKISFN